MKSRILIVDDEPRMVRAIQRALERSGHECVPCGTAEEALTRFQDRPADVVITDRKMPGMGGDALLEHLRTLDPGLPVILITAHADVASTIAALRAGAFDYVTKPFDNDALRAAVDRALELRRLRQENTRLRRSVGRHLERDMVAESAAMKSLLALVDRAAPADVPVLIQGESGTGKEWIARRVHASSSRVTQPFVAVNCKAFATGTLESELFGHERGAFTGAASARRGCFERADGGTLFLDEIGETGPGFQAALLRAVQEGEVLPVGGETPRRVDVRIVAATNRDLRAAIARGDFREDLFFRLAVLPVEVPPLRDRRDDVLPLAHHFLARHAEGGRELALTREAELALLGHPWHGNVRELENAIERAVILSRDGTITTDDLLLASGDARPSGQAQTGDPPDDEALQASLDRFALTHIEAVLARTDGNKTEAARRLGIDRSTLFRWLRRLDAE